MGNHTTHAACSSSERNPNTHPLCALIPRDVQISYYAKLTNNESLTATKFLTSITIELSKTY